MDPTLKALWDAAAPFVTAVFAGGAGWLTARGQYRTAIAQAHATDSQAATVAETAAHDRGREDHKTAVAEWQTLADAYKAELAASRDAAEKRLTEYRTEAHDRLDKAHGYVVGLLQEKADLGAKLATVTEQVRGQGAQIKACEDDRAAMHAELKDVRNQLAAVQARFPPPVPAAAPRTGPNDVVQA